MMLTGAVFIGASGWVTKAKCGHRYLWNMLFLILEFRSSRNLLLNRDR